MRIGYLIPEFPGQTHIFFWREIVALRAAGAEVTLLSTRQPPGPIPPHPFIPAAMAECHYLFPPSLRTLAGSATVLAGLPAAAQYIRRMTVRDARSALKVVALLSAAIDLLVFASKNRLDHIHVQSCADAAHIAALCRWMGGPPYSLTLHGDLEVYGQDHPLKMERAAFVAAVGTHLLQQLVDLVGVPRERVFVTWMGLDTTRLANLGSTRGDAAGPLHLATVARLHMMKGHVHALAAVRRAVDAGADIQYTIVGEGSHRPVIERRIRELGLEARVRLVGSLGEDDVFALLSRVDAFVLPSIGVGEAWPVSVMEAMAAGLPVISSIIGATPEMITSNVDGLLIKQMDEEGLAAAMLDLARNPERRRALGARARATAVSRFDVAATAGLLSDAIAGRPVSRRATS